LDFRFTDFLSIPETFLNVIQTYFLSHPMFWDNS
jgi:hypothetical protein